MKILVIDDEKEICEGLKRQLTKKNHEVHCANSAREGFDILEKEEMEAILLDYMMPEINGIDFLKLLRKQDKITPVIMVTARGSMDTLLQANRLDLVDYITKPIDWDQLDKALEKSKEVRQTAKRARMFQYLPNASARFPDFVGQSLSIKNLIALIEKMAGEQATVLILGETGTGKELIARSLHERSERQREPFVSINCAALNTHLLESELFGHEKGAFTGAETAKAGLFEVADGGSLFLDEVGEMPLELQAKFLRVLENGEFRRIGSTKTIRSDVRIITATNRNLRKMVHEKLFREDLYYRLNVLTLHSPPLRNRLEDLEDLIQYFLHQFNASERSLTPACLDALKNYSWPGNVRELRNSIERMVILGSPSIGLEDLPPHLSAPMNASTDNLSLGDIPLTRVESLHIEDVLKRNKGNKAKSARILGITKMTLYKKIREYQLTEFFPRERS
jgi:DNA-binding NtrC family response regulator